VLCAALWAWTSHAWAGAQYRPRGGGTGFGLIADQGGLYFATYAGGIPEGRTAWSAHAEGYSSIEEGAGTDVRRWVPLRAFDHVHGDIDVRCWAVPFWLLTLGLAVPAVRLTRRHGCGRRRASGLCPTCGYDLRATPERCPECGVGSSAG
jgi:hypothetical protein